MGNLKQVLTDICEWEGVTNITTDLVNPNLSINYYIKNQVKSEALLQEFCNFTDHFYYAFGTNYRIFFDRLHSQGHDSSNTYAKIHTKTAEDILKNGFKLDYNSLTSEFYVNFNYLKREVVNAKEDIDGQTQTDYSTFTRNFRYGVTTNTQAGQKTLVKCYDLNAPYNATNISTILTRKKTLYEDYLKMRLTLAEIDINITFGNAVNFTYNDTNFYIFVEDITYNFTNDTMILAGIGKKGSVSY